MRAVIVDDDEDMRQLLRIVLELEEIEIVGEAADACGGVKAWADTRPDVMVVDYRMPGANGLDLAERILMEDPEVRVLLFSAYISDDTLERAEELGAVVMSKDELRFLPALVRGAA